MHRVLVELSFLGQVCVLSGREHFNPFVVCPSAQANSEASPVGQLMKFNVEAAGSTSCGCCSVPSVLSAGCL